MPKLAFTKTVLEDDQLLTSGTGDNTYRFQTGNIATKILHELRNTVGGVLQAVSPATVTQLRLAYSQTQVPYLVDARLQCFRQRLLYTRELPQGAYCFELAEPLLLPELVGTRDVLNTARLTDLQTQITLSGVTLTAPQGLRTIREQLLANR